MRRYIKTMLASLAMLLGVGCATVPDAAPLAQPGTALPPVAAAFRTLTRHDGHEESAEWRFWRAADRVQREDLRTRTGELWQRDGGTLFHTLLFHADRRGIDFEQADLQMTGEDSSWDQQAHIVRPALLERLRATRVGRADGIPFQDYAGKLDGVEWRVRVRTDLMIPMRIEQRRGSDLLRVDLLEAYALSQAPWSPPDATGYGLVDFADLGDHERDPFVLGLQASMGIGHAHGH